MARRRSRPGPDDGALTRQAVSEFLDPYHQRASLDDGSSITVNLSQVFQNIEDAMERVDLDIGTEISIEEDVASFDEIVAIVQNMAMGPSLAAHVLNTAMRIMSSGRYPAELVNRPFPPQYDLRQLLPQMSFPAELLQAAKTVFNRRIAAGRDFEAGDVPEVEQMNAGDQAQLFIILFQMYGTKVGAMKYRTGQD